MTTLPVIYSPRSERNLQSIYRYIEKHSSARTALSYVQSLRTCCDELAYAPFRGEAPGSNFSDMRRIGYKKSATVVFRVRPEMVLIVAIFYRGRNVHARL
jgi:plasmid stabilization system protein ParE